MRAQTADTQHRRHGERKTKHKNLKQVMHKRFVLSCAGLSCAGRNTCSRRTVCYTEINTKSRQRQGVNHKPTQAHHTTTTNPEDQPHTQHNHPLTQMSYVNTQTQVNELAKQRTMPRTRHLQTTDALTQTEPALKSSSPHSHACTPPPPLVDKRVTGHQPMTAKASARAPPSPGGPRTEFTGASLTGGQTPVRVGAGRSESGIMEIGKGEGGGRWR